MPLETKYLYEFENFRLNPAEKVLLRDGESVPLTPKVFDTLCVLIENAGHLLEKDELMRKIWQDRFVEEGNLTFNIKMLRRALGDDASQPRFIKTVPRRGYRFIAEVKKITQNNTTESDHSDDIIPPSSSSKTWKQTLSAYAGIFILAICSMALATWYVHGKFDDSNQLAPILSAPFKSKPFSTTGKVNAVISPDGKYAAFTSETNGKQAVWLRQLETSENIQIVSPSEADYIGLAFSHDGDSLYFVRKPEAEQKWSALYRVTAFGGVPVKILDKVEGWISLSPDNKQISFVRCDYKEDDYCSLLVFDLTSNIERKIISRPGPIRISDNQWSPDGKSIAFAAGQSSNGSSDFGLFQIDVEKGTEREITSEKFFNIKNLKWLPKGLLFVASKSLGDIFRIWHISDEVGNVRQLTDDSSSYSQISLDKSAEKMIATKIDSDFRLFITPADNFNNARAVTVAHDVAFTPGGKIVYVSSAQNSDDVWIMNSDGSEQRQLTNSPFADFSPRVSPDERYIYFTSNRTGANQIWRMNIDGSNQVQVTSRHSGYPRFVTPDGNWVFYESGLNQRLWKVDVTNGEEFQVSEGKIYEPAFSPDGNFTASFFRDKEKNNQFKIAVMTVKGKQIVKTVELINEKSHPVKIAWTSNKSFSYIIENESKKLVWQQYLDQDQPLFLADLGNESIRGFAASPGGQTLAFSRGNWVQDAILIKGLK